MLGRKKGKSAYFSLQKEKKFVKKLCHIFLKITIFGRPFVCSGPFSPSYRDRFCILGLKSLEYRRAEFDLLLCFKIVKSFCATVVNDRRPNTFAN